MKIEILQTFYGRPDEAEDQFIMFLKGAHVDVPDAFGDMAIKKELAKHAGSAPPAQKENQHETEQHEGKLGGH